MNQTALKLAALALRAMADELDGPVEAAPPAREEEEEATRVGRDLLAAALEGQDDLDDERPRRRAKRKPGRPPKARAARAESADERTAEALALVDRLVEAHGSAARAAAAAGVNEHVLSRYRRGKSRPSPACVERLRQAVAALDADEEGGDDAPDEGALPQGRAAG